METWFSEAMKSGTAGCLLPCAVTGDPSGDPGPQGTRFCPGDRGRTLLSSKLAQPALLPRSAGFSPEEEIPGHLLVLCPSEPPQRDIPNPPSKK